MPTAPTDIDALAKAHLLKARLDPETAADAYLVGEIIKAVDLAVTGKPGRPAPLDDFARAVEPVARSLGSDTEGPCGFAHLDLRSRPYDPLWVREELRGALRKLSGYAEATILVTGLKESICHGGKRYTARLRREHAEARALTDETAAKLHTPSTRLTLLYL